MNKGKLLIFSGFALILIGLFGLFAQATPMRIYYRVGHVYVDGKEADGIVEAEDLQINIELTYHGFVDAISEKEGKTSRLEEYTFYVEARSGWLENVTFGWGHFKQTFRKWHEIETTGDIEMTRTNITSPGERNRQIGTYIASVDLSPLYVGNASNVFCLTFDKYRWESNGDRVGGRVTNAYVKVLSIGPNGDGNEPPTDYDGNQPPIDDGDNEPLLPLLPWWVSITLICVGSLFVYKGRNIVET